MCLNRKRCVCDGPPWMWGQRRRIPLTACSQPSNVSSSQLPGEWYSPTQPFPTKPPAYDRQGVTIDDLIDFTPELRAQAVEFVKKYKIGPLYTPPVMSKIEGPIGTLMLPNATGGSNWPGGAFDPETHRLYVFSQTVVSSLGLVPAPPNNDFG